MFPYLLALLYVLKIFIGVQSDILAFVYKFITGFYLIQDYLRKSNGQLTAHYCPIHSVNHKRQVMPPAKKQYPREIN